MFKSMPLKLLFVFFPIFYVISSLNFAAPAKELRSVNSPEPLQNARSLKIRRGATLERLLRQAGVPREQSQQIALSLREVFNPRRLRAGDRLLLLQDASGAVQELRYQPASELLVGVRRDGSGGFVAFRDSLASHVETTFVSGTVRTTLYDAVLQIGESPELIVAFSDIFQWDIDFFIDPRRGDRFYILFEKKYVYDPQTQDWRFSGYGDILAAAYEKRDTTLLAYSFPDAKGRLRYYDIRGNSFQKTFLKSPLNYRRITSYFSTRRRHPILKRVRAHTGVDFAAPTGTPIVAAADGKIIHIGWNGGYGKCIKISHKNGTFVTLYGHLSRYAKGLKKGSTVHQGQVIGYVGATGLATGPHLHYTMYYNGRPINPLKIRPVAGKPIPKDRLPEFQQRARWLAFQMGLLPAEQFADDFPPEGLAR
ncbi:MAG: M23 family metallopeptidase [candidate division KSB1 bacterium]|nr:M23 family metallopeptidase [candidate division KSB1 bacterium]MDQ7064795.1 M23 family metallopeptidase [candidate division KSB1 bacterium]